MARLIDLSGSRFGRWTVVRRARNSKAGQAMWECACDCGETAIVRGTHLRNRVSLSCGCLARAQQTRHGKSGSAEYRAYYNMLKRCEYEGDNRYLDYGGRGIRVCREWRESFARFLEDVGPRPSKHHSLDRIDVNGDYEPRNCRWANRETQERNKRTRRDSVTGVRGVFFNAAKGRYIAEIYVDGKTRRVGTFTTLEAAAAARKLAEKVYWSA